MRKTLLIIGIISTLSPVLRAQTINDEEIARRHKDENAVITSAEEHLEIDIDDGELTGRTRSSEETLMLTDIAPGLYNTSNVYHSSFSKLADISGVTLVPSGKGYKSMKAKQLKTVKSTASGVFYDDGQQTIITFSDLEKGGKKKIDYEIEHTDMHFLSPYYFQSYLPTVRSTYKVTCPKSVNLKWQLRGQDTSLIKLTKEEGRNTITYTWMAENLPRFKTYDNAPDPSYYLTHILVYIADYTPGKREESKRLFGTVDDLYKFYFSFVDDINRSAGSEIKQIVATLTEGADSEKEKAKRIYQYVQKNIKYVAFEDGMGGFIPREASLVCSRKYGDCKDMSSLLVMMCREAGIKAYYTWIGTRKKPYKYAETPLPVADNHMICTINIGDEWIFMDGTDSYIPFGIPPYAIQAKEALVGIDKQHYKIITVPEIAAENNFMADSTFINLSDKTVSGKVDIKMKGYGAWNLQEMMLYRSEKEKEDALKSIASRGSNKYIQKSFDYKAADNTEKSFHATSTFEVNDYAQQVGKEWYVNMNLQRSYEGLWIDTKDRKISLERDYKNKSRQVVVLDVPKGYHVSYLPPTAEMSEKNLWSFKISYKNLGNRVQLLKEYDMNCLYVQPNQFLAHNKLVEELKRQYKESVVLTAD